jgi:hypothetical protein
MKLDSVNLRRDQTIEAHYKWFWVVHGKLSDIETERPEEFMHGSSSWE